MLGELGQVTLLKPFKYHSNSLKCYTSPMPLIHMTVSYHFSIKYYSVYISHYQFFSVHNFTTNSQYSCLLLQILLLSTFSTQQYCYSLSQCSQFLLYFLLLISQFLYCQFPSVHILYLLSISHFSLTINSLVFTLFTTNYLLVLVSICVDY